MKAAPTPAVSHRQAPRIFRLQRRGADPKAMYNLCLSLKIML
jgi:hypothetical protein